VVRAIEEKTDGSRVAHFGTPTADTGEIGDKTTNPWDTVLNDAADQKQPT